MIVVLGLLYLFPRLLFALRFPIFNDEAIMIHIGRFVLRFPQNILLFAIDGRQPGFETTVGLFQFSRLDPLVTTRFMSIAFGFIAFMCMMKCAQKLGLSKHVQTVFAAALIVSPFLMLFDTLVLPDVQITAATAGALLIWLYSLDKPTVGRGILLGLILALAWWYFSLILLIIPGLLLAYIFCIDRKKTSKKAILYYWFACFGTLCIFMSPILLQMPFAHHSETIKRTLTPAELLGFPWKTWIKNILNIIQWMVAFIPAPLVFFSLFGMKHDVKRVWKGIGIIAILPLVISSLISISFSARNIVFVVPLLLLLSVRGISLVSYKKVLCVACCSVSAVLTVLLICSPLLYYQTLRMLPAAHNDFSQYVTGWPSGYGISEAVVWLEHQAQKEQFAVIVRNDSGNPEDAMFTYLEPKNIPVFYPNQMSEIRQRFPIFSYYFVSRGPQLGEFGSHAREVARFKKPLDPEFVGIYKLE